MEAGFHLLPDNNNKEKKQKDTMLNQVFYCVAFTKRVWQYITHLYLNQRKTLWCLIDHNQYNRNHTRVNCPANKKICLKYNRK